MLSELRHTHLVALIGYCNGDKEMLLVYEYMANGTVADHLYKTSQKESGKSFISHLMWEQRLNICIGAARGLDYLHTGTDKRFIHRDVKTPNILLDENWVAKIADFGLSKAITRLTTTHVTTKVKGTFGYYDLDYVFTGRITRKADVYAFGVVLLEVMCGRPALDARLDEEPEETISLTIWVLECIKNGKLDQVIDPSLRGQIKPQSLEYFVQLAKKCLQRDPEDRPTMVEVVESLKVALASQESSTVPFQAGSQKKILMDLPKFVGLKSNYNNSYMRYINEEGEVHGFLQFTGDKLVSPYIMFKVETAESGDGRLVHIRCCYNNKYLARWSPDHYWIVAEADEPQEDQSKWSCTLFEPLFVGDDAKTVRLRHVQLNHYACLWRAAPPHNSCLFAGYEETDRDGCEVYTIIDLESVIGRGGDVIQPEGSCRCFSLPELFIATNCFDDALVLGTGGFGKVYKGFIDNGATAVAIKRLNVESSQGDKEFWTEINMLSELRHTHLVALIGYCNGYQEMLLVYEYMANGTLADHLYETGKKGSGKSISHLTWERRLNICIGAARGLNYLHIGTDQSFVHRSVKTANVLLDEKWIAKISDFGLSKPITTTHVSTNVKGTFGNLDPYYLIATFGYLDPDYFMSHRLTQKSDVYAFGVVLLEVLCGRPSVDARLKEEQISLKSWALRYIKKGKLDRVIDPSLSGQITPHSQKYFAKLVDKCLRSRPKERPTMAEVVASLEVAFAAQERKGRKQGMITKVFQGIALMLKGTP